MMDIISLKSFDLISSSIAENLYDGVAIDQWVSGAYAAGDLVYHDGSEPHLAYLSLEDSNTATPGTDITKWLPQNVTDRYRMFDDYTNTLSEDTGSIEVEVDAGGTNAVGLLSLRAKTVALELSVGGDVVKSESFTMETIAGASYWDYGFTDLIRREDLLWSYPQYPAATLKATITYTATENAKCGMMKLGKRTNLGDIEYGARIGITDYSLESEDSFGRISLSKGNYSKSPDFDIWLLNSQIDSVYQKLAQNRGTPAIYDGNNPGVDYQSMIVYGKFEDFSIDIPGPAESRCSIRLKGISRGDLE